jgi:hypothetical protein
MKCINRSITLRNKLRCAAVSVCLAVKLCAASCIAVADDHVTAKDLAAANPWFAQMAPNFEAGLTPLANVTRVIKGRELLALARFANFVQLPESFADICVERAALPLTREQLQPVLDAALGGPAVILEFGHYRIPAGTLEFTRANLAPSGQWRGRVRYGDNHSTPIWAVIEMGPGASKNKSREVKHGDRVTVEVTSGGTRLAFQAVAASSGYAGESILVRNPENGRLFQAKVLEEGKVFIHK